MHLSFANPANVIMQACFCHGNRTVSKTGPLLSNDYMINDCMSLAAWAVSDFNALEVNVQFNCNSKHCLKDGIHDQVTKCFICFHV